MYTRPATLFRIEYAPNLFSKNAQMSRMLHYIISVLTIFLPIISCFTFIQNIRGFMLDEPEDNAVSPNINIGDVTLHKRISSRNSHSPLKRSKLSPGESHRINQRITIGTKIDPLKELVSLEFPAVDTNEGVQLDSDIVMPPFIEKPLLSIALRKTLQKYFGYTDFRSGQLEIIQTVLEQRDAGVFWATGSGKSLCYQIPALHTGHVVLVVSPLISLMEDQVHKLNGICDEPLGTFLGSGQMDSTMEERALLGEFPIVYVTPEKLMSGNFLDRLAFMHTSVKRVLLIAVDESHCVSEWGHDFRPEYRQLHCIRSHPNLHDIPIIALTATAVPRVQRDIIENLQLKEPIVVRQSFDRENLQITVQKKRPGGIATTLKPFLSQLSDQASTIVYVPTREQTEEICLYLQKNLQNVTVEAYHAGMSLEERTQAHTNFLIGKTKIVCATVAFGMGIDKPDTRRVWHYGSPKSIEEYYQQIGRAGRDGLNSECVLFVADSDFDRYMSDFYLRKLSSEARQSFEQSLNALRSFATDTQTCRRKALLTYFDEIPRFGDRCGTCDVCLAHKQYGDDMQRDMAPLGARIVLLAVSALKEQGVSVIEKVIAGNVVEAFRYIAGINATKVQNDIIEARQKLAKKRPNSFFREFLAPMVTKGYLLQNIKEIRIPGNKYTKSFSYYEITSKGRQALANPSIPIVLPVPESIRAIEKEMEEERLSKLELLEKAGVNIKLIPESEIAKGDGAIFRAFTKWHSYLDGLAKSGRNNRIQELENLRLRIDAWRLETAAKYRVSPSTVLAEHNIFLIAYAAASMKPGGKMDKDALVGAGVRSREIDSLVHTLHEWVDEVQPAPASGIHCYDYEQNPRTMVFEELPFTPTEAWNYSVYKPNKATGMAAWESSHRRFLAGEHPQTIAMTPENGRPIQVATVFSHILQALELGRPVPLKALTSIIPAPNEAEWNEFVRAEQVMSMNVTENPDTSGRNGGKFLMTDFLRPIIGDAIVDTPLKERTIEENRKFSKWLELLKWYISLKRAGYKPTFE
jgi:RecQ family ATP-dependent DNA helicase